MIERIYMCKKKKEKYLDDGRTIANINVDGMSWYQPPREKQEDITESEPLKFTFKEKLAMMKGIMGAAFLVVGIFILVFGLFILFSVYIWFA